MSNSLQTHGLQHARLPFPSPSPRTCSIHVHRISDATQPYFILCRPLLLLPSIFPSIRVFLFADAKRQFFASAGQSIGASASASVLPMNIQDWFTLRLTGLISLPSKWLSIVFSSTTVWKYQFLGSQFSLCSNSHPYMTTEKTIALTRETFVSKVMS